MGNKATYRSSIRSKRLIRESFSELLVERGFEKITVKDVVERADLNRSTFYAHYASLDALAAELIDEITDKIHAVISQASDGTFLENPRPVLENAGRQIEHDRKLCGTLILAHGADEYLGNIQRQVIDWMHELIPMSKQSDQDLSVHVPIDYLAGGLFSVYRSWLMGDYGDASVGEVTDLVVEYVKSSDAVIKEHVRLSRNAASTSIAPFPSTTAAW